MILRHQRRQWQANTPLDQPEFLACPFDRDRVGFAKQLSMKPQEPSVQFARRDQITVQSRCTHPMHQAWRYVGYYRNIALSAQQQQGTGTRVG